MFATFFSSLKLSSLKLCKSYSLSKQKFRYPSRLASNMKNDQVLNDKIALDSIELKVLSYLANDIKVVGGSYLLLSVSGGIDSMAMLHILSKIRHNFTPSLNIEVITFNHKLRDESDEEIEFVTNTSKSYGYHTHIRILDESLRKSIGLQETARNWRRKECIQLLKTVSNTTKTNTNITPNTANTYKYILTAHHQDDQIETILLKLLRGVHISHISPMPQINGPYLKPLLCLTKNDTYNYMTTYNYTWREDISNQSIKYKRNNIRLQLIPLLQTLTNNTLNKRLDLLTQQSAEVRKWIETEAYSYMQGFAVYSNKGSDSNSNIVYTSYRKNSHTIIHTITLKELITSGTQSEISQKSTPLTSAPATYAHLSSMAKTEIFYRICQQLVGLSGQHEKGQNYDDLADTDANSDSNSKRVYTPDGHDDSTDTDYNDIPLIQPYNTNTNSNSLSNNNIFLSYDMLTSLIHLCTQPLPPGINTRTIQIAADLTCTRIGAVLQFEYTQRNTYLNAERGHNYDLIETNASSSDRASDGEECVYAEFVYDNGVRIKASRVSYVVYITHV